MSINQIDLYNAIHYTNNSSLWLLIKYSSYSDSQGRDFLKSTSKMKLLFLLGAALALACEEDYECGTQGCCVRENCIFCDARLRDARLEQDYQVLF